MDTEPQWLKLAKGKSDSILNKKIEKPLNLLSAIEDMLGQLKVPVTQFFRNKDLKDLSEEELFELYSDLKNLTDEKKEHE
jgi:hypothetical protein